MKKVGILSILFLCFTFSFGQKIQFNNSWGKQGFSLVSEKSSEVEIIYSIKEFSFEEVNIKGEKLLNIALPKTFLFNNAGMPNLPGSGKNIAVPKEASVKLIMLDYDVETYQNILIAPAPSIPFDTEKAPLQYLKNKKIYEKDAFYPEQPVLVSKKHQLRGVDYVTLGITPFQYNPVKKELKVFKNIRVKLEFVGGKGTFGEDRLRNSEWDHILSQNILNSNSLKKIDYSHKKSTKDGEAEYVIITLNQPEYLQWADSIKNFRRQQGISTEVYTIDAIGGNTVNAIETWVNNAYNTWETPPSAILLLADYDEGASGITSSRYPHPYEATYISDNTYADVDGDELPDIVFARMTANNADELETMITKFLNYERIPPNNPDFYTHPITALGWQTERWFQICSEVIGGFWNSLGKQTVRINAVYEGNPGGDPWSSATNTSNVVDYFGPDGLNYIPTSPSELGNWNGGNASQINNAINAGAFMLQHRDHGLEEGWGEPAYRNNNINSLHNTDLPYIWSINCLTGRFDYTTETFAEKFHRYKHNGVNSGALGIMAATQVSYSFVNDVFVWGAYDNLWTNFLPDYGTQLPSNFILPAFAGASGKYFLQQSNWPYNSEEKEITYRLFHHHGDAYMNVYSEIPQELTVTSPNVHVFGNQQMLVNADENSKIAVSYYDDVNSETIILATAEGTGAAVNINLSECPPVGTNMLLTVTKQNHYRYTKNILVIAPNGPYDIVSNFVINDGNNNAAEYGESFNLDLTLENVGNQNSEDITLTLSSTDPYITSLTNATNISFPDLAAGSTTSSSNQFNVVLDNNVPDQHKIIFNVSITDNHTKSVYESILSFKVNAPSIKVSELFVTNDDNGDGRLDPGETGDLNFTITNKGHAVANFSGMLSITDDPSNYLTLGSTSFNATSIPVDGTQDFTFPGASADANTPLGSPVGLKLNVLAGEANQYADSSIQDIIIGIVPIYPISDQGTLTVCTGHFFDSGLETGSYEDNENYTMTFLPPAGEDFVVVDFTDFQIEAGYDFLYVYDGTDTNAPQIPGSPFSGSTSPGTLMGAEGLTFHFISDGYVVKSGWAADVSCYTITEAPECATNPVPVNGATDVFPTTISWDASFGANSYIVYFGTDSDPYVNTPDTVSVPAYAVNTQANTTYYWAIVPANNLGTASGCDVWSFTSGAAQYLMADGEVTTCEGVFYDEGGPNNNYASSLNQTMTFNPGTAGKMVSMNFTEFDVELGMNGTIYDYLEVYDGASTSAPLIGKFSSDDGAPIPAELQPITASNSDGALTFKFYSDGSVTRTGWTANISCVDPTATYTITFNVTDGTNPLEGANVNFNNTDILTNANGIAVFENCLEATGVNYTITKDAYEDVQGQINITEDATVNASMILIPTYTITFNVTDGTNPLEGANVNFNNTDVLTNANGIAVFENCLEATGVNYTITKDAYEDVQGQINITEDATINASMTLIPSYTITFNVTDGTNPLEGANVNFNNTDVLTNANGIAVFSNVFAKIGMTYTLTKANYHDASGQIDVSSNMNVDVAMSAVGVNTLDSKISIVPNPNNGLFMIKTSELNETSLIEIYSLSGKLILKKNISTASVYIDLTNQAGGIYFVKITADNKVYNSKLVIK